MDSVFTALFYTASHWSRSPNTLREYTAVPDLNLGRSICESAQKSLSVTATQEFKPCYTTVYYWTSCSLFYEHFCRFCTCFQRSHPAVLLPDVMAAEQWALFSYLRNAYALRSRLHRLRDHAHVYPLNGFNLFTIILP